MTDNYEEKKEKNHLDLMSRSPMSLDECKREYNNHKKTDMTYFSTPQFVDNFDHDGYSVFKSEYIYNSEFKGRADYINFNSVSGFIQEITGRKYTMGTLNLEKNENDGYKLTGYWIIRGSEPVKEIFSDFLNDNTWSEITDLSELDKAFYGENVVFRSVCL